MVANSGNIRVGKKVTIDGLAKGAEHNGKTAEVVRQEGEKWLVKLDDTKQLLLKPEFLHSIEPDKKRARFADEEGGAVAMCVDVDEADGEEEEEEDPPYTTWANQNVTIRLVTGKEEGSEAGQFTPIFTHQVFFVQESPTVEIVLAANTLKPYLEFKHEGQVEVKLLKKEKLNRTNVLKSIEDRVQCDYTSKITDIHDEVEQPFTPLGTVVQEDPSADQEGASFRVYHFVANEPGSIAFVKRLQTMAIWLIETGNAIEVPDDKWNVFTLYKVMQKDGRDIFVFLGFMTAYTYWVYDKEENAIDKNRLRISQCVVLPPFHRQGHGSRLLTALYKYALSNPSILEVSVEDPSEEFQAMRDATDSVMLQKEGYLKELAGPNPPFAEIRRRFKICRTQMRRMARVACFYSLGLHDPEGDPEDKDPTATELRLKIKTSLYKQSLCEAKGILHFDDEDGDEAEPPAGPNGIGHQDPALTIDGAGAGSSEEASGNNKSEQPTEGTQEPGPISQEDVQQALEEKAMRVWSEGGDPYERKKALKSMYQAVYKKYATVAKKLQQKVA